MFHRITTTVFNAAVLLIAAGIAVWLTITGHTLIPGGLLMALGAILAVMIFGFRLAEGSGPGRLSLWTAPLGTVRALAGRSAGAGRMM